MAKTFQLEIITPESAQNLGQITYLRAPSIDGLFGILAGHAISMIALGVGEIKVENGNEISYWATSGGYADIRPEGVQLLVETAEKSSDIDKERAQTSLKRAEDRSKNSEMDQARARGSIARAKNRLNILNR
ncbi:MAG: ATP synthase F1 subunit epsilon [Candidatus Marinimicrobia bacterium]|nr:ATP synthase F1 subunit epsilon [Candidatus Neomarinimicrobiota bacterium]MBL7022544.1 ATP synthase F1 subunit epsilon [Candidatus Neomarinimicrobiota bacterium]MBL7108900.1 ATP synthase F1 subunit epsilon [Candidatus Neomarinimicrobiota bacterium]